MDVQKRMDLRAFTKNRNMLIKQAVEDEAEIIRIPCKSLEDWQNGSMFGFVFFK